MSLSDADRTLAVEYVLGTLDLDERAEARARIKADPAFAALVRQWDRRLAPLHELAAPIAPPPSLWREIATVLPNATARPVVASRETIHQATKAGRRAKERSDRLTLGGVMRGGFGRGAGDPALSRKIEPRLAPPPVWQPFDDAVPASEPSAASSLPPLPRLARSEAAERQDGPERPAPLPLAVPTILPAGESEAPPPAVEPQNLPRRDGERPEISQVGGQPEPDQLPSPADAGPGETTSPAPHAGNADAAEPAPASRAPLPGPQTEQTGERPPLPEEPAQAGSVSVPAAEMPAPEAELHAHALPSPPEGPEARVPTDAEAAIAVERRVMRWRLFAGLLALVVAGLAGYLAYREFLWPRGRDFVGILQGEPAPALALRVDPASGVLYLRSFAPAPPAGRTLYLWVQMEGAPARAIGPFSAGLTERTGTVSTLPRARLLEASFLVTEEDAGRTPALPSSLVLYRGRLAPE